MMTQKKKWILMGILLLATILRFWRLGNYPALNADEAAIGYNAYSLIKTGMDEHGNSWPIHFESFNDFKPGATFYLALPFVKIFGLDEFWLRFPGALLGVATVYLLYLLVKKLFKDEKLALVSSFFLAISPWHIHFSRGLWEVNIATFFIVLGVYLFTLFTENKSSKILGFSLLAFVVSLYTYHAARIIVPLLGLGLVLIHRKKVFSDVKKLITPIVISIIFLVPLIIDIFSGNAFSRVAGVGLFADPGPINRINEQRGQHEDFLGLPAKLVHNKAVNYGLAFLENWSEHFHGEFLFMSGDDIQRNKVPETGVMYIFDVVFILAGVYFIFSKGKFNSSWKTIFWWLAISPFAAALTFQSPHSLRAQNMAIPLVIISSFGLVGLISWAKEKVLNKKLLFTFYFLLFTLISWQFARYQHMYWTHMAKEYPFSSQYGMSELVDYVNENGGENEKVVVSNKYDQPYILFLFFLNYPPESFQADHELTPRDEFGFSTVSEFGKYVFTSIDNLDEIKNKYPGSLIAGTDEEIVKEANVVEEIYGSNGYKYFEVVKN